LLYSGIYKLNYSNISFFFIKKPFWAFSPILLDNG
jgi:hypothetical protein